LGFGVLGFEAVWGGLGEWMGGVDGWG